MPRKSALAVNAEIFSVATQLDRVLDELGESVAALAAILQRPPPPAPPGETDERLVMP